MNYIDLFCGIGGFHQAMDRISKKNYEEFVCLFAADNDAFAADVYRINYGQDAYHDLRVTGTHELLRKTLNGNQLDFLLGGFPCQSFSKAGKQEGFENKVKGTLFFEIYSIAKEYHPPYMLLENVRNLKTHNQQDTWKTIKSCLRKIGYVIDYVIISPNEIPNSKIPALRERIFIMCYYKDSFKKIDYSAFFKGRKMRKNKTSIFTKYKGKTYLDKKYFLSELSDNQLCQSRLDETRGTTITMWNDLRNRLKEAGGYLVSPLWTYYFDEEIDISHEEEWKQKLINKSRKFYSDNKKVYDLWYQDWKNHFDKLTLSDKKFEWNAGPDVNIEECIIQFRPSGVRVKKADTIPTLVAINQKPILCSEMRYMLPEEMANLYGFRKLNFGDQPISQSYKQLGNTVSVDVVEFLIDHMLNITNKE